MNDEDEVRAALAFLQEHGEEGRVALLAGVSIERLRELGGIDDEQ